MAKGWISLHREIQDHWLWKEKREFSKLEAWFDILLTVNHSEQKLLIKNTLFTVKRGESIKSLDTWAYRWNWNKSKVRRFFKMLENDSMIVTKNERKTTRLTVCKYDSYQDMRNADETILKRKRNADETQMTPNNNDINKDRIMLEECEDEQIDTTTFKDVDKQKEIYLSNEKLIKAVTSNPKNKVSKEQLEDRLNEFTSMLKEQGRFSEPFNEYAKYFLSWCKIYKVKEKATDKIKISL